MSTDQDRAAQALVDAVLAVALESRLFEYAPGAASTSAHMSRLAIRGARASAGFIAHESGKGAVDAMIDASGVAMHACEPIAADLFDAVGVFLVALCDGRDEQAVADAEIEMHTAVRDAATARIERMKA